MDTPMKDTSTGSRQPSSALHLLHRAGQCADDLFARNIGKSDLTPRQYAVLKRVSESEDLSQTALVESTGIDRSTLADIVRRLVERGLLARKRTKEDARMYAVRLTATGRGALAKAHPAAKTADDRILSSLPAAQRADFLKSLGRIVETLSTEAETSSRMSAAPAARASAKPRAKAARKVAGRRRAA
jgi:DNA-binding MarR family transcriptional regulator